MPSFTYKALKKDGSSYEKTIDAPDRFAVYDIVQKEGGQVVSVREVQKEKTMHSILSLDVGRMLSRIKDEDIMLFTRNLGAMLQAGLSVSRALAVMERQTKKKKFKEIIVSIAHDIESGAALSESMRKHPKVFSKIVIAMVAAGEESGTLADALKTISNQLQRSYQLKKKIKGAMIYPSIIVFALIIVGILMMIFIVPTLADTFRNMGVELPYTTRVVMAVSDFLVAHTLTAIFALILAIVGFVGALKTKKGHRLFETTILHIPLIGTLVKETNSARTGRTLASLLKSGVNMLTAIDITRDVLQNSYYKEVLTRAHEQVQKGKPLAEVFTKEERLYPPLVGELIAVGEETGALPDMLREVAQFYEEEVSQKTKNMSTIIEPFLMLIVGAAVGFFAVSMISPIYSITSSI